MCVCESAKITTRLDLSDILFTSFGWVAGWATV
jgi:hypothetical protein